MGSPASSRGFFSRSRLFLKRFAAGPSCSLVGASLVTCPWCVALSALWGPVSGPHGGYPVAIDLGEVVGHHQ